MEGTDCAPTCAHALQAGQQLLVPGESGGPAWRGPGPRPRAHTPHKLSSSFSCRVSHGGPRVPHALTPSCLRANSDTFRHFRHYQRLHLPLSEAQTSMSFLIFNISLYEQHGPLTSCFHSPDS